MTDRAAFGASTARLWRTFRDEKSDPEAFNDAVARTALRHIEDRLPGARVLDLGCGRGEAMRMLAESASTVGGDLSIELTRLGAVHAPAAALDGRRLPFADATFDGVYCSNVLEHTPEPLEIVDEMIRTIRPGGWGYLSWTPWLSPWGGHAIAPLHYLGPRRGLRTYERLFGAPRGPNVPFENLWPLRVREVQTILAGDDRVRMLDSCPRYYPSQRWMMRVPGVREVATWNAVFFFDRT